MRTLPKLALLAIVIMAVALFHSRLTRACGPFFPEIIFTSLLHPDPQGVTLSMNSGPPQPTLSYATGNLGIIEPTYGTVYLFVAYRNLASRPLKSDELKALWDSSFKQLAGTPMWPAQAPQQQQAGKHVNWVQKWQTATGQSLESAHLGNGSFHFNGFNYQPWAGIYNTLAANEGYDQYLNCPQDAFRNAVSTLQRLTGRFGETSLVLKEWVAAQQEVFGNCNGGNEIPKPLPASAPAIARADRAYQIAAAYFYSDGYDKAATDFRAIAKDASSPWSTIAPYLVARALVREYNKEYDNRYDMGATQKSPARAALTQAEAQINSVLANPRYAKYHHAAEQLRGYIEFRLHPRQRLVELAKNMTRFSGDPNMEQNAIDFKLLFPRVVTQYAYHIPPPIGSKEYSELVDVRAESDLLDWMITLKLGGPQAYTHSLEKWEKTHSRAWLVAALIKAAPDSPQLSELLAAAERVTVGSPSYDSLTFQSLRLMLLQGKDAEVRQRLASLDLNRLHLLGLSSAPRSAVNQYLAMRFKLARNLNELFASAARVPALISDGEDDEMPAVPYGPYGGSTSTDARFDNDALRVLNHYLPVAMLAKAVHSTSIPENLRREVALAAWTRAALLGNTAVARSLAPSVETFVPKLAVSVEPYNSATTAAARRFAVVLTTLRFPGLVPFVVTPERMTPLDETDEGRYARNNWWGTVGPVCAPPNPRYPSSQNDAPQWPQIGRALQTIYPGGKVKPPAFLTAREDAEAASEWKRLLALGPAPDYLTAQVLAWARAHPSDPRVPEALALAVKSTRFGCADPKTGELSKAAFDLLHSRYPNSNWTAETKYWFKM